MRHCRTNARSCLLLLVVNLTVEVYTCTIVQISVERTWCMCTCVVLPHWLSVNLIVGGLLLSDFCPSVNFIVGGLLLIEAGINGSGFFTSFLQREKGTTSTAHKIQVKRW